MSILRYPSSYFEEKALLKICSMQELQVTTISIVASQSFLTMKDRDSQRLINVQIFR